MSENTKSYKRPSEAMDDLADWLRSTGQRPDERQLARLIGDYLDRVEQPKAPVKLKRGA